MRIAFRRVALVVLEPARDAQALAVRDVDDEAPGERDLGREARALRLHRVLDGLDEHRLALLDQILDLAGALAALELGADDLVDVEEPVLLEPDLDERRLHPRQHVVDDAEVDVAGDRTALGPLEIDLGDLVVLEHGDALLARVDRDQQLALGLRQRGALRRLPPARRLLPLARLALGRLPLAGRSGTCSRLGGGVSRGRGLGNRSGSAVSVCSRAVCRGVDGLLPAVSPAASTAAALTGGAGLSVVCLPGGGNYDGGCFNLWCWSGGCRRGLLPLRSPSCVGTRATARAVSSIWVRAQSQAFSMPCRL